MITIDNILYKIKESKNLGSLTRSILKNIILKSFIIKETNFLPLNSDLKRRYFHIKNGLKVINKCIFCNNNLYWSIKNKYIKTCNSVICRNKLKSYTLKDEIVSKKHSDNIKKHWSTVTKEYINKRTLKTKKTCLMRYGVDSYTKTDKFKLDMIDKKGYISPFELKETHIKSKKTLMFKYGVDHNLKIPEVKIKLRKYFKETYGNRPMSSKKVRLKYEQTMFDRYGYKYNFDNDFILNKAFLKSYTSKKVEFNNFEYSVQGYEDYALLNILSFKYNKLDIKINYKDILKETGKIEYYFNNKIRLYYPDFFIKSINKIYEIKSNYTYNKDLKKNLEKEKACIKQGFKFEFIIINDGLYKQWKNNKRK